MRRGRIAGIGLLLLGCVLWSAAAGAAEQFPSSPNHRGVAPFDPYLVFPENRPGNGVYLDNTLLFETKEQTIVEVLPLPVVGRFAYFALDAQGNGTLNVFVRPKDGKPRITEVTQHFYQLVVALDGVVYKKIYRIIDHNILDLLPSSKTADGPVAGPAGVVFYHVATTVRDEAAGQAKRGFGLKLHLALFQDERTRHLDALITNDLPELKIVWLDDSHLRITHADGRIEELSVSQFQ